MLHFVYSKKAFVFRKIISTLIAVVFISGVLVPPAAAQYISNLPKPGEMVFLSPKFEPVVLKGLSIHPENPLAFDFIVDRGEVTLSDENFKQEADKLIKYFLAAMTISEDKSWVNLSPAESDRIIPDLLGQTQMGKQMLEQDYLLKQLAASLTNPDTELGKKYWDQVNKARTLGDGQLLTPSHQPLDTNTFCKIWIVPQKAVVLEKDGHAFISESHLKVMLADEYEKSLTPPSPLFKKEGERGSAPVTPSLDKEGEGGVLMENISSQIFRSTILPAIEKEVNEGKNFAPVRQIYNSVILATWYKISLKETLLTKVYADKGKIKGIEIAEKDVKQKVYDQYLEAFRRGVYSIIQEDYDAASQDVLPRKYFSGGFTTASSQVIEIREGEVPAVGSSALRLVKVGGSYIEEAAVKTFNPLSSPNRMTMPWDDGEVTLAYNPTDKKTYLIFKSLEGKLTNFQIPGKLTDTELLFSAFKDARDFMQWLIKNSALPGYEQMTTQQQGLLNAVLAKAMLAVDEDLDFNKNTGINNILGLIGALFGQKIVSDLNFTMTRATPAERQRILDKALSEVLAQNPQFIINAAQLLGVDSENSQLTVEKLMPGGTVISSYNPETDLSIFIIRRGLERSVYTVRGNMEPMFDLLDAFKTANDLDSFLSSIKTMKNTASGYYFQLKGYILNAEYLFAVAKDKQTRQSDPRIARVTPSVEEESFDLPEQSFFKKSVSRLASFRQKLLDLPRSLSAKIYSGVAGFIKKHSLSSVSVREVRKADGIIAISYNLNLNQTSFSLQPSHDPDLTFWESRHVFNGDLRSLPIENDNISIAEVQNIMRIAELNGFSRQRRVDLLEALFAAQMLDVKEFEILSDGKPSLKVQEIVDKFGMVDNYYFLMKRFNSVDVRKRFFIETVLFKLVENLEHQAVVATNLNSLSVSRQEPSTALASSSADVGGIDFNPAYLNLQIKRDNRGVPLPLPQQNLDQINIEGLYPVILNIAPVTAENSPFLVSARKN